MTDLKHGSGFVLLLCMACSCVGLILFDDYFACSSVAGGQAFRTAGGETEPIRYRMLKIQSASVSISV